jgi:hypothetical protein
MRVATKNDYQTGNVLISSEGFEFKITYKYADGVWETNKNSVVFESEARFYKIND